MHFTCSQPEILQALQKVSRAVASNTPLPALTGILCQVENNILTLHGTDLDLGVIFSLPVEVIDPGRVLLPARILTDMVRRLPPVTLSFQLLDDNTVVINYLQSQVRLNTLDPDQFPDPPASEVEINLYLPVTVFKDAVRKVSVAASNEDTRSIFAGILLEIDPDASTFNLVATDTHRLAVYNGSLPEKVVNEPVNVIISSRSLNELTRLLPGDEGNISINIGRSLVYAYYENIVVYTRLLEGKFPHYHQVIPASFKTRVTLANRELLDTVERATILARDEARMRPHIVFLKADENLKITSEAAEVGRLEEELEAAIEGENITLALNGRYLLESLRIIDTEEVILEMLAPLKPLVIKPAGADNYICLILPIRVNTAPENIPPEY